MSEPQTTTDALGPGEAPHRTPASPVLSVDNAATDTARSGWVQLIGPLIGLMLTILAGYLMYLDELGYGFLTMLFVAITSGCTGAPMKKTGTASEADLVLRALKLQPLLEQQTGEWEAIVDAGAVRLGPAGRGSLSVGRKGVRHLDEWSLTSHAACLGRCSSSRRISR